MNYPFHLNYPSYTTLTGGFPLSHHFEMLVDDVRVNALKRAIDVYANPSKHFLEVGSGTGIFVEYARHRFARASGIEMDPDIMVVARRTLTAPGPDNWALIEGDARHRPDFPIADVVLCELLSTWCAFEPMVEAVRALGDCGVLDRASIIPSSTNNMLELVHAPFARGAVELRTPYFQFDGVAEPASLSPPVTAYTLDFAAPGALPDEGTGRVFVTPTSDGTANAVRLTSNVDLAPGVSYPGSDTLMPKLVVPAAHNIAVRRDHPVEVHYTCHHGKGMAGLSFAAYQI